MNGPTDYPFAPVNFTAVTFADTFWRPRLETNRSVTLPFNFRKCEETGRISNFAKAAGQMAGAHEGIFYNDSDVFKGVEGAAYCLALAQDPELDNYLDNLIALFAGAQEEDGYLYTARTIDPAAVRAEREGLTRWSHLRVNHELYNVGHLYEAAAAHFQATGKRTLLDVALKNAALIDSVFGPDKLRAVPGHQEIEIGLAKLYRVTGEERWLRLAKFFLDERGHANGRELYTNFGNPGYMQDHLPVLEQAEAVGHSVRAVYMYTGMADVAALTGDSSYIAAIDRLWENVVGRKLYITGGIGARHTGEAFGDDYELPNAEAYAETCAAIANILWNQRMFLLHGDARYIDVLELSLYNGFLSGVSFSGDEFFYTNPLASDGKTAVNRGSLGRQPWFDCSCCPTNDVRFLASLPGYVYATTDDTLYVNLFVAGEGEIEMNGEAVGLRQETAYPWDGRLRLRVDPAQKSHFSLALRIPGWANNQPVPSDLYRFADGESAGAVLTINGETVTPTLEKGYAVLRRVWQPGDVVEMNLPMPVRRVLCNEAVETNRGRVALMRGPLVYCVEGVDNGGSVSHLSLADTAPLSVEHHPELLNGVTVIRSEGAQPITAIPYYAWSHRGPGEMAVWVQRQSQ
ncbi:MAG TPA: glycoside hydrolase family 127 protein [Caldilineaceae bacterium]|nr:glycoside hydrolase family 127 protein [Caldilineaceae bacterium]